MGQFLPTTKEEMLERGWQQRLICSGDAYVEMPSFGASLVRDYTRTLESRGFKWF